MTAKKVHKVASISTDFSGTYYVHYSGDVLRSIILFADSFEMALLELLEISETFDEEAFIRNRYNISEEEWNKLIDEEDDE